MGEQILGGEWLFRGVESKTMAYAAVVAALGIAMSGRWLAPTILVAVATYFHFLVGGFWVLGIALLILIKEASIQKPIRICISYFLLVSPLLAVIVFEQFGHQSVAAGSNVDAIYVKGAAHHVAPFYSKWVFWKLWATGVVTAIVLTLAFIVLAKRTKAPMPPSFVLMLLLYLLLALVISFFDKDTFYFSKFYLFRPSSLILLLAIATFLTVIFVSREKSSDSTTLILRIAAVVFISLFLWTQVKAKVDASRRSQTFQDLPSLITTIESKSKSSEVVLIEKVKNHYSHPYVGLPRHIPRPTLVGVGIPSRPSELLEWRERSEYRKSLFENGCKAPLSYPIRLLLVFNTKTLDSVKNCGEIVWQSKSGYLVRIDDRWAYQE